MTHVSPKAGLVLALAALSSGCNNGSNDTDGGTGDGGQVAVHFQPSNFSLDGHDLSAAVDVDATSDCTVTGDAQPDGFLCGSPSVDWIATQSDGSKVHVFVVKSLTLESNAKLTLNGGLAVAVVALGDIKLLGPVKAGARQDQAGPGGYSQITGFTKGSGPGGGPAGVADAMGPPPGTGALAGISGGGGSYCGQGGIGTQEVDPAGALTISPGPAAAAYGSADLRPLLAGSSGGTGGLSGAGAGGGAVQFVAGGSFTLGPLGFIDVGGGGGSDSGETYGRQEASGAGSGGAVLIEANSVTISGIIAANGGGGGGHSSSGQDATPDGNPAAGGTNNGAAQGGSGGAGTNIAGSAGTQAADSSAGAGGGGVGRVRINSASGAATITGTVSPGASTSCTTQGMLRATGSGI